MRVPDDVVATRLKDEPVEPAALRDESFALDERAEGRGYNAAVLALCSAAGFVPAGPAGNTRRPRNREAATA